MPSLWASLERQLVDRLGRKLVLRVFAAFLTTLVLEGINYTVLALTADLDKKENGCGPLTIAVCSLIMVLQLLVIVMTIHHLVTRSWVVKLRDAWMLYITTTLVFTGTYNVVGHTCAVWTPVAPHECSTMCTCRHLFTAMGHRP